MSISGIFKVVLFVLAFHATFYFNEVNARDVNTTSGFPNHPWIQLLESIEPGSNLKISRNKRNLFGIFGSRSGSGDNRSCRDKNRNCAYYARENFCNMRHRTWMNINCKRTCGKCGRNLDSALGNLIHAGIAFFGLNRPKHSNRNGYYYCPSGSIKFKGLDNLERECSACWSHQIPVDGCSAQAVYMKSAMDKWLYDSCKIHDYCYRTSGMPKDTCDYQFYMNMKTQCGDSKICSKGANKAYLVLQSAPEAKEQYAEEQKDACRPFKSKTY